jgi:hypothetical protein
MGDVMATDKISAAEMANSVGVDPKAFRDALRSAGLAWHQNKASWVVKRDSPQHDDMKTVLVSLLKSMRDARQSLKAKRAPPM